MEISNNTEIILNLGTIVAVLVFFSALVSRFVTFKDKVENKIESCRIEFEDLRSQVRDITSKQQSNEISLAEIKTKLINIEGLLIDMKQQIKIK